MRSFAWPLVLAYLVVAGALIAFMLRADAHAPYDGFYSGGAPGLGRWCCNGNLEGTAGDCSPADYTMNRDGSAFFRPASIGTKPRSPIRSDGSPPLPWGGAR